MPLFAGVNITIADLSSWEAVVVVFLLCSTRVVITAMRADGPLLRALVAAFKGWVRRRHQ